MSHLKAAVRLFAARPGLCAAVIVTLGVALGSATAIFSVGYALLLRPLPFRDADRIVTIEVEVAGTRGKLSLRELRELERDAQAISNLGTYYLTQYNLTGGGPPQALTCTMPSSVFFEALGVRPLLGEIWPASWDFTRQYTVALSHRLWQQRFGGRRDVIGESLVMDGGTYRIAAVMPPEFDFPLRTDVYRAVTDYNAPHVRRYSAVARLAEGRTLADAQRELDGLGSRFADAWPDTNRGVRLVATPLRDAFVGGARPFVLLMAGGVALLLLIAGVNVTNLLLSRALSQQGDFAVRLALGATRRQLVRQPIIEALLLALAVAVCGAAAARIGVQALNEVLGRDLPPWLTIEVDVTVLAASAVLAVMIAVAVSVLPGRQAATTDVERVLRQESGRTAGAAGQRATRRWLVGTQTALASLLLMVAGIFAIGLRDLLHVDTGFTREPVVTFRVDPPYARYGDIRTTAEFYRRAAEELGTIPGVVAVGTNTTLPFARLDLASPRIVVEGRQSGRAEDEPFVNFQVVGPGYFEALRIPLIDGRDFHVTDREDTPAVAVVSERTARRLWKGDGIGRRRRITWNQRGVGTAGGSDVWLTVVGVVGAVRFGGIGDDTGLDVYAPHTQMFAGDSYVALRTAADLGGLEPQIRTAIDRVDREQSFFDVSTMEERVAVTLWQHRVATAVLVLFAAVALVLAIIGTYAVTAHAIAAQRREIGIRLALGSSGPSLGWVVARTWIIPVLAGVGVGVAAGAAASRSMAGAIGVTVPLLGLAATAAGCACVGRDTGMCGPHREDAESPGDHAGTAARVGGHPPHGRGSFTVLIPVQPGRPEQ